METFHIINQIPKNLIPVNWNFPWMGCILKFRSLKISLETFERSLRRGEKTEISREASSDIWNSLLCVFKVMLGFKNFLPNCYCCEPIPPDPEYISPSHSTQVFLGVIYSLYSRCRVVPALDLIDTLLFFLPKDDCTKLVSWLLNCWLLIVLSDKFLLILFFRICI